MYILNGNLEDLSSDTSSVLTDSFILCEKALEIENPL